MNNIKKTIGWADYSWNPITGCSPASEGCKNCYAAEISKRFNLPWGDPVFHPERLDEPAKLKKPARIFVCSMSDMFHPLVRREWKEQIYRVMETAKHHTYIILTKRIGNVMAYWATLPNVWLGVSAENQQRANERIPELMRISAARRVVSVEPMLGPVDLPGMVLNGVCLDGLSWVIAGPETGAGKRQCKNEWINDLARQCADSGTAFYDKRRNYVRREWPV